MLGYWYRDPLPSGVLPPLTSKKLEGDVPGDLRQPRPQAPTLVVVVLQLAVGDQEHLLGHVVERGRRRTHGACHHLHVIAMGLEQLVETRTWNRHLIRESGIGVRIGHRIMRTRW